MKILVTGGAGFIASHIAEAYLKAGHDVSILDNQASAKKANIVKGLKVIEMDVRAPEVGPLLEKEKFEIVNHHAAQVSVSVSVKDPEEDASVNLLGALNLFNGCVKSGVKKVIFASSGGTVYGPTDRLPATEDLPFDAGSPYGVAKVATELYLRTYQINRGLKYTALRYSNVYGPRQDPHGEAGVVAIFAERMLTGDRKPMVFGDGEYLRDYVYVGDVVRANLKALEKGDNDFVNIGTAIRTSTNRVFELVKKYSGYPGPIEHGPARAGDLRDSCLAIGKAKKVLDWEPEVGLEKGFEETVKWFRAKLGN